jgi:hypothetical protein
MRNHRIWLLIAIPLVAFAWTTPAWAPATTPGGTPAQCQVMCSTVAKPGTSAYNSCVNLCIKQGPAKTPVINKFTS